MKKENKFVNWIKKDWWAVLIAFGSVIVVGGLSAIFVKTDTEWFQNLVKPMFYPPNLVFSIVWGLLYVLMGIVLYVLISKRQGNKATYILFALNGLFNILWCLTFFTLQNILIGMLVLIGNFILGCVLFVNVLKQNKKISWLLIPYLLWLAFAFVLNYLIFLLN